MAATKGKVKKAVSRKRREKKNIERGAAHIRSSFNNTMVTITDVNGNAISWASRRPRLPRQQEEHSLRSADGFRDRSKGRYGAWPSHR